MLAKKILYYCILCYCYIILFFLMQNFDRSTAKMVAHTVTEILWKIITKISKLICNCMGK